MKRVMSWFFVFLFLVAVAVGVPPVQISGGTTNLVLLYPKVDYFEYGSDSRFHLHVLNSTGMLLNASKCQVLCFYHLYNGSDRHLGRGLMTPDNEDLSFKPWTNVTGFYTYNVWCNSTVEGGWLSGSYYVINGPESSVTNANWSTGFLLLLGLTTLISVGFAFFTPKDIFMNNDAVWVGVKALFFIVSVFLLVNDVAIVSHLSSTGGGTNFLISMVERNFRAFNFVMYAVIALFAIALLWAGFMALASYVKGKKSRGYRDEEL